MSVTTVDPWYALGDPTRRRVFAHVARGPRSVTEIAQELPVSRPAVSQHLRVLLEARLVDVRQEGRQRLYQVRSEGLERLRDELESYWTQTLTTFKELAERDYQATATTTRGGHVP
ncbi:ArsR/SmtB family transcription factor [Pseudactinotalea terrae]|uniref:ArsR/SmtB family transcription factor n=1 Tax=Pseudactinotalea terrae TaxID=1743262 RepID=UPI001F4FB520|nr:metalloregulator ArsR/SmtB family transcription factor [Pseudactinotalea terrae]